MEQLPLLPSQICRIPPPSTVPPSKHRASEASPSRKLDASSFLPPDKRLRPTVRPSGSAAGSGPSNVKGTSTTAGRWAGSTMVQGAVHGPASIPAPLCADCGQTERSWAVVLVCDGRVTSPIYSVSTSFNVTCCSCFYSVPLLNNKCAILLQRYAEASGC